MSGSILHATTAVLHATDWSDIFSSDTGYLSAGSYLLQPTTDAAGSGSILDATTGVHYATVSDAISGSDAGDLIEIPGGTYQEQFPKVTHDLTIEGVGGLAHLESPSGQQPTNGQGILVTDANVTLENLELSGATVGAGNGAGVRQESGNLTVINSWIHDNQNGILTSSPLPGATLTISRTEFSNNGAGDGKTHNLYVGELATLDISDSYFTAANLGHEIKSRADNTIIRNSRIQDGPTADTSYSVDLPNGGNATIENNVIEKGPNSPNESLIAFGEEGSLDPGSALTIINNTVIDDRGANQGPFVLDDASLTSGGPLIAPVITGNTFYGPGPDNMVNTFPGSLYAGTNTFLPLADEPTLDTSQPFVVPCYCAGTQIDTEEGPVRVEALRAGDRVLSAFGGSVPVVWVGHIRLDLTRHPRARELMPVRVRAGAFGDGLPRRDLLLSPEHAIYVDDVLVPVRHLVNNRSVHREYVDTVAYFHVEVPAHDVLLAEGLPAESYLDTGYRGAFANGGPLRAVPDDHVQRVWEAEACAPHVTHGPIHARVMARLQARAMEAVG